MIVSNLLFVLRVPKTSAFPTCGTLLGKERAIRGDKTEENSVNGLDHPKNHVLSVSQRDSKYVGSASFLTGPQSGKDLESCCVSK